MFLLKQSTAITIQMGPALDATDGVSEEAGLAPTVYLSKNGAAFGTRNSAVAIAHDRAGWYRVPIDTTDTNTLGRLYAHFSEPATHLPVWHEYMIIPANEFDSLVSGTDALDVEVASIAANAITAAAINTAAITADKFGAGAIDATAIASGAIDADAIAANAIGASEVATDAVNEIRDSILSDSTAFAGAQVALIKSKTDTLPGVAEKNTAINNVEFFMHDSSGNELTGLSPVVQRSIDGSAFVTASNSPATSVSNGLYKINLSAADMNGDFITFRTTASGAVPTKWSFMTQ